MSGTLHITNGEAVSLNQTGLEGEVIFWRDVLHEGPVPAGLTLEKLSAVRARFLAGYGAQGETEIHSQLVARDRALAGFRSRDEVVLWFEHDLYDQLQLIQILDWFSEQNPGNTKLSLIQTDIYLGRLAPEKLATLYPTRQSVTEAELQLANRAWQDFRSPTPTALAQLVSEDTIALPYLQGALLRHLEQFPSATNGLSRTERQILEFVEGGASKVGDVFRADHDREERIFMATSPSSSGCRAWWKFRFRSYGSSKMRSHLARPRLKSHREARKCCEMKRTIFA